MRVYLLGSGTPTPTAERFGTSYAVEVGGQHLLIDCGPATTWKLAKAGLKSTAISSLFFTHHHFDHNADYPCFLLTRWDQSIGNEPQLKVYGPPPTVELTDRLIGENGAFRMDYLARMQWAASQRVYVNRGGTLPRPAPRVEAQDIVAGFRCEGSGWSMRAAAAQHAQPYLTCLSYRLDTPEGSLVFTGDTEPCDSVRELAQGADGMLCMAWGTDEDVQRSGESAGVCALGDAVRLASEARVGKLVLVHVGASLAQPGRREEALRTAASFFGGEIVLGCDVMTVDF